MHWLKQMMTSYSIPFCHLSRDGGVLQAVALKRGLVQRAVEPVPGPRLTQHTVHDQKNYQEHVFEQ